MPADEDVYGSDDAIDRTPPLSPRQINYKPSESPPPFLPDKASQSSGENGSPPSGGARPNHPDIAQQVGQNALNSASQSEAGESEGDMGGGNRTPTTSSDPQKAKDALGLDQEMGGMEPVPATSIAQDALRLIPGDEGSIDSTESHAAQTGRQAAKHPNIVDGSYANNASSVAIDKKDTDAAGGLLRLKESSPKAERQAKTNTGSEERAAADSSATSPNLRKFQITASEGSTMETLPALQKSPPRSASAHSPDANQNLPSLQTALGHQLAESPIKDQSRMNGVSAHAYPPVPSQSPTIVRTTLSQERPLPGQYLPGSGSFPQVSPTSSKDVSSMSPPTGPSHPTYWRAPPKTGAPYTPLPYSDPGYTPSQTGESPSTSYPTPTDHRTSTDGDRSGTLLNGPLQPNGPFTSSGFKCTHPGCTAQPFQTQYLLNSHANVHSQNRPHYCSVKDCPRGIGGKGFKRKNEMIRHGLVHDSPGYVCPFCPDQQHRYPRPDNLQRHVRVHHVDKDRDDPQLRQVLAQRPEGGNRGRRRRLGG